MAGPRKVRGFTLVELLVVITIIGMLVSLLLPAIQSAREAGRKNTCQSNMRQAALALINFEQNKKGFPGYVNQIPKNPSPNYVRCTWVVPILPYMERNDLYQNWQNPNFLLTAANLSIGSASRGSLVSVLNVLVCPSNPNPDLGDNPLSFAVNTGSAVSASDNYLPTYPIDATKIGNGQSWPEDPNSGVFFDQAQAVSYNNAPKKVTMDFISTNDGTSNTLMMSENLQAGNWATDPQVATQPISSSFVARQAAGIVWYFTGNLNNQGPPGPQPTATFASGYIPSAMGVNDSAYAVSGNLVPVFSAMSSQPSGLAYARPSSNHPGGVNAAFCDGHMRFLNDEIAYHVYTQLMTPNQKSVIVNYPNGKNLNNPVVRASATAGNANVGGQWIYTLNEADF